MELTSSLTTSGRYIKLKHNPNGSDKQAYIRKYLRNDSIKTRGELLAKYHLSEDDLKEIELFIRNNKKVSAKPTIIGLYRQGREQLTKILKHRFFCLSTTMRNLFHKLSIDISRVNTYDFYRHKS